MKRHYLVIVSMGLTALLFACDKSDGDSGSSSDPSAENNGEEANSGGDDGVNGDGGSGSYAGPGALQLGDTAKIGAASCPTSSLGAAANDSCALNITPPNLSQNMDDLTPGTLAISNLSLLSLSDCSGVSRSSWSDAQEVQCGVFSELTADFRYIIKEIDQRLSFSIGRTSDGLRKCMLADPTLNNLSAASNSFKPDFPHYLQCTDQMNDGSGAPIDWHVSFGKNAGTWYVRTYGLSGAGGGTAKIEADKSMEIWSYQGRSSAVDGVDADLGITHIITDTSAETVEMSITAQDGYNCGFRSKIKGNLMYIEARDPHPSTPADCSSAVGRAYTTLCLNIGSKPFTDTGDLTQCTTAGINSFSAGMSMLAREDYPAADADIIRAIVPSGLIPIGVPDPLMLVRNTFFKEKEVGGGTNPYFLDHLLSPMKGEDSLSKNFSNDSVGKCLTDNATNTYSLDGGPFSSLEEFDFQYGLACYDEDLSFYGKDDSNFYGRDEGAGAVSIFRLAKDGTNFDFWAIEAAPASDANNRQAAFAVSQDANKVIEISAFGNNVDIGCGGQVKSDGEYVYLKGMFIDSFDSSATPESSCLESYLEEVCASIGEDLVRQADSSECQSRGLTEFKLPKMLKTQSPNLDPKLLSEVISLDTAGLVDMASEEPAAAVAE